MEQCIGACKKTGRIKWNWHKRWWRCWSWSSLKSICSKLSRRNLWLLDKELMDSELLGLEQVELGFSFITKIQLMFSATKVKQVVDWFTKTGSENIKHNVWKTREKPFQRNGCSGNSLEKTKINGLMRAYEWGRSTYGLDWQKLRGTKSLPSGKNSTALFWWQISLFAKLLKFFIACSTQKNALFNIRSV